MQALDLRNNSLQWETERQNRIHQEAVEQKKKQMRVDNARRELQFIDKVVQDAAGSNDYRSDRQGLPQNLQRQGGAAFNSMTNPTGEWADKVRRIPEMRSAWIPLDESAEGGEWSRPFALSKADMEPWLSFFKGYWASRLFLEVAPANRNQAHGEKSEPQLDFAVRALLELRQLSAKVILEPPVQINGQVEYLDLEGDLQTCSDAMLAKTLIKVANEAHASQLAKAVEKGRAMGNLLYDALMGDGHVNLINAWGRAHNRKPSVEELHLMLATGRVKVFVERRPLALEVKERLPQQRSIAAVRESVPQMRQEAPALGGNPPQHQAITDSRKTTVAMEAAEAMPAEVDAARPSFMEPKPHPSHGRKILLYLFHAAACCATLVAYWYGFVA